VYPHCPSLVSMATMRSRSLLAPAFASVAIRARRKPQQHPAPRRIRDPTLGPSRRTGAGRHRLPCRCLPQCSGGKHPVAHARKSWLSVRFRFRPRVTSLDSEVRVSRKGKHNRYTERCGAAAKINNVCAMNLPSISAHMQRTHVCATQRNRVANFGF
jgi:hypothetical protein